MTKIDLWDDTTLAAISLEWWPPSSESADIAIETGLALCLVLHQPLRQTEGVLRSIADLLGI